MLRISYISRLHVHDRNSKTALDQAPSNFFLFRTKRVSSSLGLQSGRNSQKRCFISLWFGRTVNKSFFFFFVLHFGSPVASDPLKSTFTFTSQKPPGMRGRSKIFAKIIFLIISRWTCLYQVCKTSLYKKKGGGRERGRKRNSEKEEEKERENKREISPFMLT